MGIYLNPGAAEFRISRKSEIYIDKSMLIANLNSVLNTEQRFVCVSRPRRFGKSMAANMVSAYYDRSVDRSVFDGLKICGQNGNNPMPGQGQYDVIRINMQEFLSNTPDIDSLLVLLQRSVLRDLTREYPNVDYLMPDNLSMSMKEIYNETNRQFVIVIDEWDCIFREYPHDKKAQKMYLDFLRDLMKDKSYAALVYMTGILPIKKYGTHSALNMFFEYSMEHPDQYAEFVGFTEEETRTLCEKYHMDFGECQAWYDGYSFPECPHVYSPKSVVDAMIRQRFGNYWNSTETYEALKIYIDLNEDGLRDAVVRLIGGGRQKINTGTFQNDMTSIHSADDVLTLLVHLGYLGYDSTEETVFIPNNEIMREFANATEKGEEWNIISRSVRASDDLLQAVWDGDEKKVAKGVEEAHFETSTIQYNDENALSYVLSLAFFSARRYYSIVREMPAGKGYADLILIPRPLHQDKPAVIIELKWDHSADTALRQIHERRYERNLSEDYKGRLILVGISYNRQTKEHVCKIEKV